MRRFFWTISKYAFFFLIALLIIGAGAAILVPHFTPAREGCYWTSAMIGYIECPKVPGGQLIAFVLNLPFRIFMYAPLFFFHNLFSGEFFVNPFLALSRLPLYLMYFTPLVLGLAYPIRWLWLKVRSKLS